MSPSLPFEIITEILLKLPVKFLMTLKWVCKPWNALISSDRKFARKHLQTSTINPHLIVRSIERSPGFSHIVYHFTHKYKVVVVFIFRCDRGGFTVYKTQVMVHTSATHSWRLIDEFPIASSIATSFKSGTFVSGTINWLVPIGDKPIVSLHLGTDSYQQILHPDYGEERIAFNLGILRDCLCLCVRAGYAISEIWLMKEYGNPESWTKLVTVPSLIMKELYISEDDQMLLQESTEMFEKWELVVYDPINGTLKSPDVENLPERSRAEIYVESLISPHS